MKQLTASWQVIRNSLTEWWYAWLSLLILNTLLALCWITVVLGPPATFGFYYAVHSLITTHGTNWREFVQGTKRYFFKGWLWMLMNTAAVLLLRISIEFYSQFAQTTIFLVLTLVIGFVWFCIQFYGLTYLVEQEKKDLRHAFRNALLTVFASPLYTLMLLMFLAVILWLSLSVPILFVIGSPALIAVLGIHAVRERLTTFNVRQRENDQQQEEPEL